MPKGYILAEITVPDPEAYRTSGYPEAAEASIVAHGGRYLVRGGNPVALEGDTTSNRFVILEFPSRADAERFYHGEQYGPAKAVRHRLSTGRMLLLDGYDAG